MYQAKAVTSAPADVWRTTARELGKAERFARPQSERAICVRNARGGNGFALCAKSSYNRQYSEGRIHL
jgi:hypothetical protein